MNNNCWMLTQPSHKGRLSQDRNLWHSVPSYLFSVIKATQHPVNSATARPWYMTESGNTCRKRWPWSCLLPKVTVLKNSTPLLDAWLLGHTLGINQKTLGSPLDCKEIKPVNPKRNEPWIFTGRTDAEAEAPILWTLDAKSWLTGKRPSFWERLKARGEWGACRGWDG